MTEQRLVNCVKLKKELPGLTRQSLPGELGKKIYDNVSAEAWKMFLEYFKMIVNEYRLDLSSPQSDRLFLEQVTDYFFGKGGNLPEQYTPEK